MQSSSTHKDPKWVQPQDLLACMQESGIDYSPCGFSKGEMAALPVHVAGKAQQWSSCGEDDTLQLTSRLLCLCCLLIASGRQIPMYRCRRHLYVIKSNFKEIRIVMYLILLGYCITLRRLLPAMCFSWLAASKAQTIIRILRPSRLKGC